MSSLRKEFAVRKLPSSHLVSIYFGGGTPSLLGSDKISEILSWICPNKTCEITLEANPEHITLELMKSYAKAGVNRISLGVQSFDANHLVLLTRMHTPNRAERAILQTAEAGIENISIDLMYDLPHQTLETWEQSLIKATSLPIKHLSLYNLTIEPHTSFYKKKPPQPTQELSLKMLQLAVKHLEKNDLQRYEISAFSKPSYQSQHNIGYWSARPFLGFGPSAFSYWNEERFRNCPNLNRYARALNNYKDPTDFREKLSPDKRMREQLAIELRLARGVAPTKLLDPLIEEGFCEKVGDRICLTKRGKLFYDTVAEKIV